MSPLTILALIFFALLFIGAVLIEPKQRVVVGDPSFKERIKNVPAAIVDACYVYNDGVETSEIRESIPIIGYRLSPNLVIHDMSGKRSADEFIKAQVFAHDFNGQLLNNHDVETLKSNLRVLNILREKIGEPAVPEGYFWIEGGKKVPLATFNSSDEGMQNFYNINLPSIILKR
ncbi:MAG: hypothetical protein IKS23_05615 [Alphaproteobacteria bacterium]|nr:hypothetical protein [Alphaproteobacteria bacterium]